MGWKAVKKNEVSDNAALTPIAFRSMSLTSNKTYYSNIRERSSGHTSWPR